MTDAARRPPVRRRKPPSKASTTAAAAAERGLKIGEAARALGVEAYVLRFWETQFPVLKPVHSRTKHRFYHERDLKVLRLIKRLLHDEGFTIAGANKHIREAGLERLLAARPAAKAAPPAAMAGHAESRPAVLSEAVDRHARRVLGEVRRDLESIHKLLEN